MEAIFDSYTSADAANEVVGRLEYQGTVAYVREIEPDVFQVVIEE